MTKDNPNQIGTKEWWAIERDGMLTNTEHSARYMVPTAGGHWAHTERSGLAALLMPVLLGVAGYGHGDYAACDHDQEDADYAAGELADVILAEYELTPRRVVRRVGA